MLALPELQRRFAAALLNDTLADLPILDSGLGSGQWLDIYRNNSRLGLTEALIDIYPIIAQLVGDGFFRQLCQTFLRQHPPQRAGLVGFGEQFADFIQAQPWHLQFPYLASVAQMEWLWQQCLYAADAPATGAFDWSSVPAEDYPQLRFRLHPAAALLASNYPLHAIWQANQEQADQEDVIDLNQGGCQLLLYRPHLTVQLQKLSAADFQWLSGLAADETLMVATERALAVNPQFPLTHRLYHWLSQGLIILEQPRHPSHRQKP